MMKIKDIMINLEKENKTIVKQMVDEFVNNLTFLWKNEPLDGDATEEIYKMVLKELNNRNGNK